MAKSSLAGWNGRKQSLAYWFIIWFGVGLLRPAPGTWGSFAGVLLAVLFVEIAGHAPLILIGAILILSWAGAAAIDHVERASSVHDAPEIVVDEVAGQWVAVLPILCFNQDGLNTLSDWGLAFVLFRLFDIIKPWPIGWLDRHVTGGWGVMFDDLVAGLMAALVLTGLLLGGLY